MILTAVPPPGVRAVVSTSTGTKTMSLKELLEQHKEIEQQLVAAREREAQRVLGEIVRTMREYKISLKELVSRKDLGPEIPKPTIARYRDPASGATWSGRGRAPHWIVGKNRDDFLIE
jgi:DNA-binding protein H-NS